MAPRLKVFCWSDGFHAFSVAASSRQKALDAWGIGRDIFKDGLAWEVTRGADHAAALKSPGEVIERGLAVDIGKAAPRRKPAVKRPSEAARRKVEALETELDALDHAQAGEREALEKQAAVLEATQAKARSALVKRLKAARAAAS